MKKDEQHIIGIHYCADTKTLVVGIPRKNIQSVLEKEDVCTYIDFGKIIKATKLKLKDIKILSFTTADRFLKNKENGKVINLFTGKIKK